MTTRRRRRGEAGAETIEFIACLGMLVLMLCTGLRAVSLVELQTRAQGDARNLARLAALCGGPDAPVLSAVDPQAPAGSRAWLGRAAGMVTAHVELQPVDVLPALGHLRWTPAAAATMVQEPRCASG